MTLKDNSSQAVRALLRGAEMRDALRTSGNRVAEEAMRRAPRGQTGAGAASIRADVVTVAGIPEARVSWDRDHFYMSFIEFGTRHQDAAPFLRPAASLFM